MVPPDEAGVPAAPTWPARVSGLGLGAEAWLSGIAILLHAVGFAGSANAGATDPSDMLPRKIPAAATGPAIAAVRRRVMVRFLITPLPVSVRPRFRPV